MNNNNVTIDCHIMLNATIPNFGAVKNTFEMSFKKVLVCTKAVRF